MILKRINPIDYFSKQPNFKPTNKRLILLFAGWGMDEHLFSTYKPINQDLIILYDYSNLNMNESFLDGYEEIQVFAWSIGVWAAGMVLPKLQHNNYPIRTCTAINGTAFPIDNKKGIPVHIFKSTLNTLTEETLNKFRLRMCGSSDILQHFLDRAPLRDIEDLRSELIAIEEKTIGQSISNFQWDQAYIGREDRIFSMENQKRAWTGTTSTIFNAGHYPYHLFQQLLK